MSIVLRPGLNIGSMSAEDDSVFLKECFVSTGAIEDLASIFNPKCIVLGRTGSGKSAILQEIERRYDNVIRLNAESLSLNYISNSDILSFFSKLGIDLDVFYQLLWRHVLAVEVIKLKKQINDESSAKSWIANLFNRVDQRKKEALSYLFEYGDSFWADTEQRIREIVQNIEKGFESNVGISVEAYKLKLESDLKNNNKESIQKTTEIIHKAQKVVNEVQIQKLNSVIDLLADDIFADKQQQFYIIIDDLDTGWVHDAIRFRLIRALIETIKKFRRVSNLKVIIGLRADLLETVLQNTTVAGFQQEKYDDLFLRLRWSPEKLKELADRRIEQIFKDQYTGRKVVFNDVFAKRVGDTESFEYILERSLDRPRDIIAFVNQCLEESAGQTQVNHRMIRKAEISYSSKRLKSITDEWRETFGDLESVVAMLSSVSVRFRLVDITDALLEDACIEILNADGAESKKTVFVNLCNAIIASTVPWSKIRQEAMQILYTVGAIGVKVRNGAPYEWSFRNEPILQFNKLNAESEFAIHPMLFKALNKYSDPRRLV